MERISRRDFLRVSALASAATLAAACVEATPAAPSPAAVPAGPAVAPTAQPAAVPPAPAAPAAAPKFGEAPMLAERVAKGELPPAEERLPDNPYVAVGLDGVGNYGGSMRKSFSGQADGGTISHLNLRGLLNINSEMTLESMGAESWELTPDGKTFTFHLRKGMKWSDGQPMTATDFQFYLEDFLANDELNPSKPQGFANTIEGKRVLPTLAAPDDFTLVYTFQQPKPLFVYSLVLDIPAHPKHYFQQFHATYQDKATLDKMVKDAGRDNWTQLYGDKNTFQLNIERPNYYPWLPVNPWTDEYVVAERNPYFWEVDEAGNQLPYIDNVTFRVFSSLDVAIMWAVNGEIDCQARHIGEFANYTVYKENEAKGDYATLILDRSKCDGVFMNMTAKNERLRKLINERDFRFAVSYMFNRQEYLDLIYEGFGTFKQYTPPKSSPYYYPKLAEAYLEYDPDKANALMDGLGYTERDSEGYRVYPDGSGDRIVINYMAINTHPIKTTELLADYFKGIGIQLTYKVVDRSLSIEAHDANEIDGDYPGWFDYNLVPLAEPRMWVRGWTTKPWAVAWQAWYDDPTSPIAEKPPDGHWIWNIWELWDQIQVTADAEEQKQLFFKILDIWYDELPCPCFVGDTPQLVIVKNGLKGIKGGYPYDCCSTIYEYIMDDATWYWDEPAKHTV
jgi:peptide/nickel transport system substrate-binding protein